MPIPESPSVIITVTGLMLLCLDKENHTCRIGAHRRAPDHKFKVSVYEAQNSDPTEPENREEILNLSFLLQEELRIEVRSPAFKGVYMFREEGNLEREKPEEKPQDSRWIVDFESQGFYDRHLDLNSGALFPGIHLNHGLVYTKEHINKDVFGGVVRKGGDKAPLDLFSIADSIGINLYLDKDDSEVRFKWDEKDTPFLTLPRPDHSKLYEIVIENNPPVSNLHAGMNHFERYFELFSGLAPQEELSLDFLADKQHQPPESHDPAQHPLGSHTYDMEAGADHPPIEIQVSDDIPCMPGVVGVSR